MALSRELLRRLDEEDVPVGKRLHLALTAFHSSDLMLDRKEELVLNWLCEFSKKTDDPGDVWAILETCLSSSRMKQLGNANIRPAAKTSIAQVFTKLLRETHGSPKHTLLSCALSVMESGIFQQHFKRELSLYFELVGTAAECTLSLGESNYFLKIVLNVQLMNKLVFSKEDFAVLFVSELLNLIRVQDGFEQKNSADIPRVRTDINLFKCVQQVLFPKSWNKDISLALKSLFENEQDNGSGFCGLIFEFLSSTTVDHSLLSESVYSLVFHAFVASYKNDPLTVYRMFISVCFLVGFKPEIKQSDNAHKCLLKHKMLKKAFPSRSIKKSGEVTGESLKVLKSLLNVLTRCNVELDASDELPFHQWLQSLIVHIFTVWSSCTNETYQVSLLEALCASIHLDPLIIEPKVGEILEEVMLSKKETPELKSAYATFLDDVLEMFIKLSRLQKLVARLLTLGKVLEGRNGDDLPVLSDVLTPGFCIKFQTAVAMLPGRQAIAIMRSLLYHFKEDCVDVLERQEGFAPVLFLQITSELFCNFLHGTRIAEHTVPIPVVTKFNACMTELQSLLGRLGQAILQREHSCPLMRTFLKLGYCWGEMRILLLHYGVNSEPDSVLDVCLTSLQEDINATNLSYLHPYISSDLWNLVAQRISNFAEMDIKELLEKMILQKLRAIILFVEESRLKEDVTAAIAKHVASHIKDSKEFILTEINASLIVPFMNPEQLETVATSFLHEAVFNSGTTSVMLESRELSIAFIGAIMNGIVRLFSRAKRKHDSPSLRANPPSLVKDVLSRVETRFILQCLSEKNMETLSPVIVEMATMVNEALRNERTICGTNGHKLDSSTLHRYLQFLISLPLMYLPEEMKSAVVVSILALAITLEEFDAQKEDEKSSDIRRLIYKDLLLGLLEGPNPPNVSDHLDIGQLAHWLSRVDTSLSRDLQNLFFQKLFALIVNSDSSLEQLKTGLPILQKNANLSVAYAQDLEKAVALLQVLSKHLNGKNKEENHILCDKYERRLSQVIVRMVENADNKAALPAVCEGFSLMLELCLNKGHQKHLDKLTPHLSKMLDKSLSRLQEKEVSAQSSTCSSDVNILLTALRHRKQLNDFLPPDFVRRVWTVMNRQCLVSHLKDHMKLLFEVSTEKEFVVILKDLHTTTKTALKPSGDAEALKNVMLVWKAVIQSELSDSKPNRRKVSLEFLTSSLSAFLVGLDLAQDSISILPVLELLITAAQNSMLYFSTEMLDLCFKTILSGFVWKSSDTLTVCSTLLWLLQALMKTREALMLDHIPSLLASYRRLSEVIASHGHVERRNSPVEMQRWIECAHRLERLTNTFKNHKPHFARVAQYLVADLLQKFETYTLTSEVKLHLSNCVNILLDMCDTHSLSFLSRTLSPASQQLLKSFHASYSKYYRFTGKV